MSIRRLKFKKRKKILQKHVSVVVSKDDNGESRFSITADLESYSLKSDARVFVEARQSTTLVRYPLGACADHIRSDNLSLSRFKSDEGLTFRLVVTDAVENKGLRLAEADRLRPLSPESGPQHRTTLLPVIASDDLRWETFRIEITTEPVLLVNAGLGNYKTIVRDHAFMSLVYPQVLRTILFHAIVINEAYDPDVCEGWESDWLRFALALNGGSMLNAGTDGELVMTDVIDWIDEVCSFFARSINASDHFRAYYEE